MLKKYLSIILSVSIFLSSILIDGHFNLKEAFAGKLISSFDTNFSYQLTEGYTNGIPEKTTSTNNESALFSFSMEKDPNSNTFVQGVYELSYPVSDGVILKLTVEKDSESTATVTYDLISAATGNSINYTETAAKSSFTILSYSKGIYETQAIFSSNGTVSSGNYLVNKKVFNSADPRDANGTPGKAVFHITSGSGYSFEYGGTYAHFRWDSVSKNFEFYTEGLKNGNIYDVELTYKSDLIPAGISETISIFTGMSLEEGVYQGDGKIPANGRFIAAPFANEYQFEKDILNGELDPSLIPGNSADASDGTNGIRFGFTAPKVWNSTTNAYDKLIDKDAYDLNLRMQIGGRQVNVTNIMNNLAVTISGDTTTYIPNVVQATDLTTGKFYFDLINLPIGVIYDSIEIVPTIVNKGTTTASTNFRTKSSKTNSGSIFTFPNYEVVKINSQFYVKLIPFKRYNNASLISGTYLLKTDDNPSVTQWSDGKSEVYFPLPISASDSAGATYDYQIFFNPLTFFEDISNIFFTDYVHSQKYHYIVPPETGDIKTPENFEVVDYNLSGTAGIDKKIEQTLTMELKYDVAIKTQLDKMLADSPNGRIQVRYSLSRYLDPNPNDPNKLKFAYVELDIYLGSYTDPDTLMTYNNVPLVDYTLSYDSTFSDSSKIIKTITGERLNHEYKADSATEVYFADFTFDVQASRFDATPINSPINFQYPNIYFLTVNTYEIDRDGDYGATNYETAIGDSSFQSITLNDITDKEVPPPQNIAISNVTLKSFDVTWTLSGDGLRSFLLDLYTIENLKNISDNIGATNGINNIDAYYNIYIGTNEGYMYNTFSKYPLPDTNNTGSPNRTNSSYTIDASNSSQLKTPYNLNVTIDNNGTSKLPIDVLREKNGVVMIKKYPIYSEDLSVSNYNEDTYKALQDIINSRTNLANMLSIDGLDKNQKYYVFADLVVENQETGTSRVITSSKLSPLVGETTLSDLNIPVDEDKIPPAPELKLIETSVDTVKLSWNPVIVTDSKNVSTQVEYDIISIRGEQILDANLKTKESFTDTWENYIPAGALFKKGYRTDVYATAPNNISIYDEKSKTFSLTTVADLDASKVTFLENGLTPNQIYFYYVRSVRVTTDANGNVTRAYSTWSRISATTQNVKNPTNLKINTIYKTYDPETEVVLNFDAPITDTTNIGIAYDFYYSYKLDGGAWSEPVLMKAETLRKGVTGSTSTTTNFNYVVSGLNKGSNYTFKVKMVDRQTGASSLYSNEAKAKTDVAQGEYDDDIELGDWENFILDKLKDMINDPYWVTKDRNGQKDVVYREEKWSGVISSTNDRFVTLIKADDTKITNYYIPASSYELLSQKGLGLKIVYKDTEFILSNKALTDNLAQAKASVTKGNTKDYYIKLSVSGYTSGAVNGENALSDIMTYSIVTTGFNKTIKSFENSAYNELLSLLENNPDFNDLIADVKDYIVDGKTDLQIQELVYKGLPYVEKELLDEIHSIFNDSLSGSRHNKTVTTLDNSLMINLLNVDESTTAKGYSRVSENWLLNTIISFGTTRSMTVSSTGIFLFTGQTLSLSGLTDLDNVDNIKSMFTKYGLSAYLGQGETFNADNSLTGSMVMGTVSKIMGMNSLEDPVEYLKNKGINATERASKANMKSGDTIYYLMKVYEYKTGTNIDTVNITNYGATSNMSGLSSANKKSIQVATQVGLITDPNFNANAQMTVKNFLEYLNKLDSLIKL